jgi:hypothetical protein
MVSLGSGNLGLCVDAHIGCLALKQATVSHACAAPPPSLTWTGERSTFSLGMA